jgi:hypothetical protein
MGTAYAEVFPQAAAKLRIQFLDGEGKVLLELFVCRPPNDCAPRALILPVFLVDAFAAPATVCSFYRSL